MKYERESDWQQLLFYKECVDYSLIEKFPDDDETVGKTKSRTV
jgi:hypothetical protein